MAALRMAMLASMASKDDWAGWDAGRNGAGFCGFGFILGARAESVAVEAGSYQASAGKPRETGPGLFRFLAAGFVDSAVTARNAGFVTCGGKPISK